MLYQGYWAGFLEGRWASLATEAHVSNALVYTPKADEDEKFLLRELHIHFGIARKQQVDYLGRILQAAPSKEIAGRLHEVVFNMTSANKSSKKSFIQAYHEAIADNKKKIEQEKLEEQEKNWKNGPEPSTYI